MNTTYKYRVEHNLCRQCGCDLTPPTRYKDRCEPCGERQKEAARERYRRRIAQSVCCGCGGETRPGKTLCAVCAGKRAAANQIWYHKREGTGRCRYCAEAAWQKSTMCQFHFVEKRLKNYKVAVSAVPVMIARLNAQGGCCFYTGVPLVAGVNLSLDHYLSVKRNPDLASEPSNLVWADESVNNAKREIHPTEFVAMCERVVAQKSRILTGVPT